MNNSHNGLRSAAVFALCGLFAVLAMGLSLLSSGVYRSAAAQADQNYTRRTALSFLVNQVRRSDEVGCIALGRFGGSDALVLTERLDGANYVTILYCFDGSLRELYTEEGTNLPPEEGMPVLELQSMETSYSGGLLTLTVTADDGAVSTVSLSPRCTPFEEVGDL